MDTVLSAFADHVASMPDRAFMNEDALTLSFQQVDFASDRIAALVLEHGLNPGATVGWIGSAGALRLLVHVGLQKAGVAFCGPALNIPPAHMAQVLSVADCALVLTEDAHAPLAHTVAGELPVVSVALDPSPCEKPSLPSVSGDLYCFKGYTSGSTGVPKVVPYSRRATEAMTLECVAMQRLDEKSVAGWPGTLWENGLYAPFVVGARITCYDTARRGAAGLGDWMHREKVTALYTYPTLFQQIMETSPSLPELESVTLAGEPLTAAHARIHAEHCRPDARLVNQYGNMEYPFCTSCQRRAADPIDFDIMPLGHPETHTELSLVDTEQRPVPDGQIGEIMLTSELMPRGYAGHVTPPKQGTRYATLPDGRAALLSGDLAYRDADGLLHFAGRADTQIKIRGYKVSPPEVERLILDQPGVTEAAVSGWETPGYLQRLVCHFAGPADPDDIRQSMALKVPNFMIPSVWRKVDALPRTHSGKIKRSALPRPEAEPPVGALEEQFPAGVPQQLAGLFRDLLSRSDFGPTDDFFDLGGDSLQAMQLVLRIEEMFGQRLPFENMMLRGCSVLDLTAALDQADRPVLNTLRAGKGSECLFVTHTAGGHLSDYLEMARWIDPTMHVLGASGNLGVQAARTCRMEDLARASLEAAGDLFDSGRIGAVVGYSFGAPIAAEICRILSDEGRPVPGLVLIDPLAPWIDRLRWVRPGLRALRRGDVAASRRALRPVAQSVFAGRRGGTVPLDLAHDMAWLRYVPKPVQVPRCLILSAQGSKARHAQACWSDRVVPDAEVVQLEGDHFAIMRGDEARAVARHIGEWLAQDARSRARDRVADLVQEA